MRLLAQHRVFRFGVAVVAGRGEHERKMPARAAAGDAESLGIDADRFRVGADVPHGAANVGGGFENVVLRRAAVAHDVEREPFVEIRLPGDEEVLRTLPTGIPAAALNP